MLVQSLVHGDDNRVIEDTIVAGGGRYLGVGLAPLGMHLQLHFDNRNIHGLAEALSRSTAPVVIDHMARLTYCSVKTS